MKDKQAFVQVGVVSITSLLSMWRVIKAMYNSSRSAVLLEGEKSSTFSVEQGVAQGCRLSPILFSVFISDLLEEIDRAQIGIQLKSVVVYFRR